MLILSYQYFPANIYLFKVNNRNTRKRCEICSKLTITFTPFSGVSIVDFEHVIVSWVNVLFLPVMLFLNLLSLELTYSIFKILFHTFIL